MTLKRIAILSALIILVATSGYAQDFASLDSRLLPLAQPAAKASVVATCTAGTKDTYYEDAAGNDTQIKASSGRWYGQSFKFNNTGKIYSISVFISIAGAGDKDVYLSWSATTDIGGTTNRVQKTLHTTDVNTWVEFVVPVHPAVDTTTQYYFGIKAVADADTGYYFGYQGSDVYANGSYRNSGVGDNVLATSVGTADHRFRAALCN